MTFTIINELIEKYFTGETSLEEEQILRGYFKGSNIDPRLLSYAPLFQFFEKEKDIVFEDSKMPKFQNAEIGNPKPKTQNPKLNILRGGYFWKIAATLAFLVVGSVAIFKVFEPKSPQIVEHRGAKIIVLDGDGDPELAYEKVKEALSLVSKKMKKGTDETTDGLMKLKDATTVLNKEN
jgi:hypothetical protein